MAAALPLARVVVGTSGLLLLLAAAFLPRLLRTRILRRFLAGRRHRQLAIFFLPLLLLAPVALYKAARGVDDPLYLLLVREDSAFEWLTALCFFVACAFSIATSRALWRAQDYLGGLVRALYAGLFLFVGLEEIAYGQRLLGLHVPDFFQEHNVQEEMTLHNLAGLEPVFLQLGPFLVGLFGALGWVALACRHHLPSRLSRVVLHAAPPWFTASYFALFALYYALLPRTEALIPEDQEMMEFVLGAGFLAFTLGAFQAVRRRASMPPRSARAPACGDSVPSAEQVCPRRDRAGQL